MTGETFNYKASSNEKRIFLVKTYLWMCFALLLSAATAFFTANPNSQFAYQVQSLVWGTRYGFMILAFSEIALVWILSAKLRTISVFGAFLLFSLYSIVNGVTLSSIFIIFEVQSIVYCFVSTAIMFLLMALYGAITKQSLARAGHYLMMALLGIIIVSVVNTIVGFITGEPLHMLDWVISLATVVIFTGLTAVDSQKILRTAQRADDSDAYKKLALYGALELYLDFINIFLALLRLFGRSRN